MKICLTKEECYCSVPRFYDNIARKLGYDVEKVSNYDCRKIDVSNKIFDEINSYCKEVQNYSKEEFGMMWCIYGPKCNEELSNYDVDIQDGFIEEVA